LAGRFKLPRVSARACHLSFAVAITAALSIGATTCSVTGFNGNPPANTTCLACHDGFSASNKLEFTKSPHNSIACETCHGPGDAHIRNGGRNGLFVLNPGDAPFVVRHEACADCHNQQIDGFLDTAHFTARAATCTDCHDVHRKLGLAVASNSASSLDVSGYANLCGDCHGVQTNDFLLSGHAQLNVATCGSCHNPHVENQFQASPIDNSMCLQCHASFELGFDTEAAIDAHTGAFHPVDPAGTGASRCTECHLPPLERFNQDDGPHDHTLFTIPPAFSNEAIALGVSPIPPNSCSGIMGCHDADVPNSGMPFDVEDMDDNDALQALYEMIGEVPDTAR
jgi:predicted CXXCH cytochrome family protein